MMVSRRVGLSAVSIGLGLLAVATPATAQNPVYSLDTIPVSVGSRVLSTSTRAVEVITASQLASRPFRSLNDALDWALSVDLQPRSPAQADISLRGGSFEQILVLVDGVRMSDPQTGHFDLDLAVPIERIERIEILRGAASAVYGADAFGGVINIVTKGARDEATATVRMEGGTFGEVAGGFEAGGAVGAWDVSGGVSYDEGDGHRDGTDFKVGQAQARVLGQVAGGRLAVDAGYAWRDFGAADFYAPFPSYEETRTRTGSARWAGALSERVILNVGAALREHDDDFVLRRGDPAFYQNIHASNQTQFESSLSIDLGASDLVVGAEWASETVQSNALGNRNQERTAAFAELAVGRGSVSGQLGARLDQRDELAEAFLSPSASIAWRPSERLRLRTSAARAFRAPTWTDRYYEDPANLGNPNLEVERGWSFEAGADLSAGRALLTGTVFRRNTNNLIDWARLDSDPNARWETRNVESADFTGLELALSGMAVGSVDLRAGASFINLETSENPGFFSKSSLRPLTRSVMVGAGVALPAGIRLEAMLQHRRRTATEQGEFLDLRLALPVRNGEVWVDGTNLLDDPMPDLTGFAVAGRALRVGFRAHFGPSSR